MTRFLALLVVFAGVPALVVGQEQSDPSPDSLVKELSSPDWQARGDAVQRLQYMPAAQRPGGYATAVIHLLEMEATDSAPGIKPSPAGSNRGDGEGEGYGEYILALVESVVALHDPRSLKGLALLGIQTGRASEEYVASLGDPAIPYLDEAWKRGLEDPVATTWAYMTMRYSHALSRAGRLQVLKRLLATAPKNGRAFGWAMINGPFPEAIPILEDLADTQAVPITRRFTEQFASRLKPERDALSGAELLGRLGDWVEAFCLDAAGSRSQACQVLVADVAGARVREESGPLDSLMAALHRLGDDASVRASRSDITPTEARLLTGNATFLEVRGWSPCRTAADTAASARYSIQHLLSGHEDTTKVILVKDVSVCRAVLAHYRADSSAIPGAFSGYVFRTQSGFILYLPSGAGLYVVFSPRYRIQGRMGGPE